MFDQFCSFKIRLRFISVPEVLGEIALPEIVNQFGRLDLVEGEVQGQRFGCTVDRDAILGQVAELKMKNH